MRSALQLLGFGCLGLVLVTAVVRSASHKPVAARPESVLPSSDRAERVEVPSGETGAESLPQTQATKLAQLEEAQQQRHQAATNMLVARERLQFGAQHLWSGLLETNAAAFLALRKQAAQSPTGETHCTLCDGYGYLGFCILCPRTKGKCGACQGSGRLSAKELCPTCEGSGKCFLCSGFGKMLCPFCERGTISLKRPLPPARLPIE